MSLSTALAEATKARAALTRARDYEWEHPVDPDARRRVSFWEREVRHLDALPPTTVIPLF